MPAGSGARTVLLTGASGVVGRAIAEELTGHRVIGLVHSDPDLPDVDEVIRCDVSQPRLGLAEERWRELAREVDVIVHSAALTEWGAPLEQHEAINVAGTREVVELAAAADAPIHLQSTAFVNTIERGLFDELGPDNVVRSYLTTKLEAERIVAASGVPHTVYRSTNLVGNSQSGRSGRPQIVQRLSAWICRGKAPYLPIHPGNVIDVVPVDVVGMAVARAVEADDLGRLYWLAYGDRAMTVDEMLAIAVEHARSRGRTIDPPPVVDATAPLPVPLDQVPGTSRRFLKILIDVSEVTSTSGGVLPSSMAELGERLDVPMPSDREAYRLSLEYWAGEQRAGRELSAA